jgi:hypothetical protein
MSLTEISLLVTTLVAIMGGIWAIFRERNKPRLEGATTDQVRSVVKEYADKSNARRDLRLLQIDNWAFNQVMPWGRDAVVKFDKQGDQVQDLATALGRQVERIHLAPFPEMPPPLLPE